MELEQIVIDNEEYSVIKKIAYKGTTYFYLQNNNDDSLLIQKLVDDKLINLADDNEIKKALIVFAKENVKDAY